MRVRQEAEKVRQAAEEARKRALQEEEARRKEQERQRQLEGNVITMWGHSPLPHRPYVGYLPSLFPCPYVGSLPLPLPSSLQRRLFKSSKTMSVGGRQQRRKKKRGSDDSSWLPRSGLAPCLLGDPHLATPHPCCRYNRRKLCTNRYQCHHHDIIIWSHDIMPRTYVVRVVYMYVYLFILLLLLLLFLAAAEGRVCEGTRAAVQVGTAAAAAAAAVGVEQHSTSEVRGTACLRQCGY